MALKTQGFALSALPRAPQIPGNVGVIDVKAIYDGVRQGLAAVEAARSAPSSMILADAQTEAATEQAPLKTRQVLAQTEGIEQQTPLKTAILAEEASPEMQEAKRQALLNRGAKAPSGDVQLAIALANARQRLVEDPSDAAAAQLVAAMEPIVLKKSAVSAANPQGAIDAGITKAALTNASRENVAADTNAARREIATQGVTARTDIADRDRESREKVSGQTLRSREDVAKADRESRERVSAAQNQVKQELQAAKTDAQKQKLSASAKARLDALDTRTDIIERSIDEALPQIGVLTSGFAGSTLSMIPGTSAKNVRRLIDAVKANVGFEELNNLRAQSPTGGALGQVSERELEFLQSVLGSLQQDQSPAQLKQNLELIRDRYRELKQERHEAFQTDFGATSAPAAAAPKFKIVEVK